MCYVHLNGDQLRGRSLLPTETWKSLMAQAIESGMRYTTLTGGECLTYPGFKELYLYLQSRGIEVTVLTNGALIDADWIEFFKAHPPVVIRITVYGASEEGYERVTGRREFEKVMGNIRALRANGIRVGISVTQNEFMTDACDVLDCLHDEGLQFLVNPALIKPREETERGLHEAALDQYVEVMKHQRKLQGKEEPQEIDPDELPDANREGEQLFGLKCGAGRSAFCITWDGMMEPCNGFSDIMERPLEIGFAGAWKRVNKQANEFPLPAECNGCKYEGVCLYCVCMHRAGASIGHANPAICEMGKRMVAEGIYKLGIHE